MSIVSAFICLSFDERSQIFILQNIDSTTIGKLFALASLGKVLDNFGGWFAPEGFALGRVCSGRGLPHKGFARSRVCTGKGLAGPEWACCRNGLLRKGLPREF